MVETQFSKRIKIFRFDNALEYIQYAFQVVLHSYDTVHQLTCLDTSQQNGRAEWKFRHILDTVRALLLFAKVLAPFWDEAALHAIHAINCIPSPVIQNQTPYKRLFGSPPDYHHLCFFSFACFVLLQPHEHNKLEPRSRFCCFLGYDKTQKEYWCYDPVSHYHRISHNVVFWEHRSFVELSHFPTSLSSFSILNILPGEAHIPFVTAPNPPVVTLDSPTDFFVQPLDITNPFPSSPFNEQVEDEQVEDELPNLKLGSPGPALPKDLTQNIPPRYSTQVRSILAHLLDYHCYTTLDTLHEPHTYREASTDPLW